MVPNKGNGSKVSKGVAYTVFATFTTRRDGKRMWYTMELKLAIAARSRMPRRVKNAPMPHAINSSPTAVMEARTTTGSKATMAPPRTLSNEQRCWCVEG